MRKYYPVLLMLISSLLLYGCGSGGNSGWAIPDQRAQVTAQETPSDLSVANVEQFPIEPQQQTAQQPALPTVKVAILLPMSGPNSKLGQSMLNAAQMALFDIGFDSFELLPKDTMGTPDGARTAAREAIKEGAELVLGPVFSPSVKAAKQVTESANINMIAFTTDWSLANNETYLIGFLPFDQVERVIQYAAQANYRRIGVLSPEDSYGNAVVAAYRSYSNRAGVLNSRVERFNPDGKDVGMIVRKFADYDARKAATEDLGPPFDAVLMPVGGTMARQLSSFLSHYDLPPHQVKRLGTGLMDDESLASDRTLAGTWFAAPNPKSRNKFERRYQNVYGESPLRIASLAYDATALSAILARIGLQETGKPAFDQNAITNPNGFSGVDGIFRFRRDGIVERGLAVLEYKNGHIRVLDPAPKTFQQGAY